MLQKSNIINPATLTGSRPGPVPYRLDPHLSVLTKVAPEGSQWLHEIKHDGFRMTITIRNGKVCLWTRNGYDWTYRLRTLASAINDLGLENTAMDSELVCMDQEGRTDFELLQSCISGGKRAMPMLYLFDIVHLDYTDLSRVQLVHRKELLHQILMDRTDGITSTLRYSDHVIGNGHDVYEQSCRLGLEGIVSKRIDSKYQEGKRSKDWLKVKNPVYGRPFKSKLN
ncbi:hypothetical protein [Desulfuromonas sp. TF]|uniref:ATP-dependent DNA ligase n=1 Tax=Desulfuromonas sp. TF TaxID=1232410 RepID=UPI0006856E34|nr:hypothetical protein [Desulfuromonas sp. TF]